LYCKPAISSKANSASSSRKDAAVQTAVQAPQEWLSPAHQLETNSFDIQRAIRRHVQPYRYIAQII
jgi:hypothetical protein